MEGFHSKSKSDSNKNLSIQYTDRMPPVSGNPSGCAAFGVGISAMNHPVSSHPKSDYTPTPSITWKMSMTMDLSNS